jgi:hypothetical protein
MVRHYPMAPAALSGMPFSISDVARSSRSSRPSDERADSGGQSDEQRHEETVGTSDARFTNQEMLEQTIKARL